MEIELTESLWDLLFQDHSEEIGEDNGTAWMFSQDEYITIYRNDNGKVFGYYNPKLELPAIFVIDRMMKTAGTLLVQPDLIMLKGLKHELVLYSNKVIQFRRNKK